MPVPLNIMEKLQLWGCKPTLTQCADPDNWAEKIAPLGEALKGLPVPQFSNVKSFNEKCTSKIVPLGETIKDLQASTLNEMRSFSGKCANQAASLGEAIKGLPVPQFDERMNKASLGMVIKSFAAPRFSSMKSVNDTRVSKIAPFREAIKNLQASTLNEMKSFSGKCADQATLLGETIKGLPVPQFDECMNKVAPLGMVIKSFAAPRFSSMKSVNDTMVSKIAPFGEAIQNLQAPMLDEMKAFNDKCVDKIAPLGEAMKDLWVPQLDDIKRFNDEHPALMVSAGIGLTVVGTAIVLPMIGLAVANATGFSASGPVAGSMAAGVQSSVYGAYTCGAFSVVQSFAMTAAPASAPVFLGGCAAIAGGITVLRGALVANKIVKVDNPLLVDDVGFAFSFV